MRSLWLPLYLHAVRITHGSMRILRFVSLTVFFFANVLLVGAEREAVKVLTIGNSFANDATFYLKAIAEDGGKQFVLGKANIGGCSLERHARHLREAEAGDPSGRAYKNIEDRATGEFRDMSLPELLVADQWDFVTIQQQSLASCQLETYQPHADELIAAIRKYAPTAEILVHQTWAYRDDHSAFQRGDGFNPEVMQAQLRAAYRSFAASKSLRILPVGEAFDLARTTPRWTWQRDSDYDYANPAIDRVPLETGSLFQGWRWSKDAEGNPRFVLDGFHSSIAGRYLGAAVWYQVLFDADTVPTGNVPKALTAEEATDLRTYAISAVQAQRDYEAGILPRAARLKDREIRDAADARGAAALAVAR
jgi:hypothetical protein